MWYSLHSSHSIETQMTQYARGCKSSSCPVLEANLRCLGVVSALVFQQSSLFGGEVDSECDRRDAEAGEGALEAVEACEGAGVPPLLTVTREYVV